MLQNNRKIGTFLLGNLFKRKLGSETQTIPYPTVDSFNRVSVSVPNARATAAGDVRGRNTLLTLPVMLIVTCAGQRNHRCKEERGQKGTEPPRLPTALWCEAM